MGANAHSAAQRGLKQTRTGWLTAAPGFHNAKLVGTQPSAPLPLPLPLLEAR